MGRRANDGIAIRVGLRRRWRRILGRKNVTKFWTSRLAGKIETPHPLLMRE
jgi:hypothetical protein